MIHDGAAPTRFPARISIETVGSCNAKCSFCPHPALNKNEREQLSEKIELVRIKYADGRVWEKP